MQAEAYVRKHFMKLEDSTELADATQAELQTRDNLNDYKQRAESLDKLID